MQNLRVAVIQATYTGSRASMKDQYRPLFEQAAEGGAGLVCLPEFSLSPYFASEKDDAHFAWAEPIQGGESASFFAEMARAHRVSVLGSLYEKTPEGAYFDTTTLHNAAGDLIGTTRKIHIPAGAGYHENYYFKGASDYPVYDLGALRIAAPTCYDQWFPELARIYSMNGAEFIFYPSAIGSEPNAPHVDSQDAWQTVMRGNAIANGVFIGAANRVGQEGIIRFYGSSFICNPMGEIIAQAGRDSVEVIFADLDPQSMATWRELFPLLHQRVPQSYARLLERDIKAEPPAWLTEESSG